MKLFGETCYSENCRFTDDVIGGIYGWKNIYVEDEYIQSICVPSIDESIPYQNLFSIHGNYVFIVASKIICIYVSELQLNSIINFVCEHLVGLIHREFIRMVKPSEGNCYTI